ncbi:hypothetical protein Tsubulata_045720 [Turnera subulata]|uniref:Pentacotripeptide-repeat region of PRORP domain-containing protein n=1 Tax=Turnera subulata TaxID=218843 RepID=A0A9Q0FFH4_9ROSI|nr:hypothetical protein Tsubulata_045720 [Turnera subulata]
MSHFNSLAKSICKHLVSFFINSNLPSRYINGSGKCIRSLHGQTKPRNPTNHLHPTKNPTKSNKPGRKQEQTPKVYMRDTIWDIYRILKYYSWDAAQEELATLDIKWDSYTVNKVLKTHPPMEKAWLFFNWAARLKGFKHDQYTYTTMLDIFGEAGRIASMNYVFGQMQEKGLKVDAITYTSLMHWVSRSGDVDGAVKIWEEMKGKGCYPTVVSYTAYIKVLFDNGRVKEGTEVYKEMLQSGISPNCFTYTVLMEHLTAAGKYEEALEIFSTMQEAGVRPDKAACNILVDRCCKAGEIRRMMPILEYMKRNRIVLRYPVFMGALNTLQDAGESDALLRQVNPHFGAESIDNKDVFASVPADDDDWLDRGLALLLLKKQSLLAIDQLLAGILNKNILLDSWIVSTIIEVNCDKYRPEGALLAFEYSSKMGIELERTAYLALIGILMRTRTFKKVVEIVQKMIEAGHPLGVYLGAVLIYKLGHIRQPTCAAEIFNLLPDDHKCSATYTALIGVYFCAGSAEKALKIYTDMKRKGIHPSLGTYNVLLAGLERSGRVRETETLRKEKKFMMTNSHCRSSVQMEEKICDLLFAGDFVT